MYGLGVGIGVIVFSSLLGCEFKVKFRVLGRNLLELKFLMFMFKVKLVIFIILEGGFSYIDIFDLKLELVKYYLSKFECKGE